MVEGKKKDEKAHESIWSVKKAPKVLKKQEHMDLKGRYLWFSCIYFQKSAALHPAIRLENLNLKSSLL